MQYQQLDGMDRIKEVCDEREKYENEFEEQGLINLKVSYSKVEVN